MISSNDATTMDVFDHHCGCGLPRTRSSDQLRSTALGAVSSL